MTFLIVQHLDPTHRSLLPELLQPCTTMKVSEAANDTPLRANEVYVVPSNQALSVSRGRIKLSEPTFKQGVRYSVDHLFTSLAKDCGPRAVGVVLSGAGSDGTAGVRDIRIAGGLAIAQEPTTSGQPGMPESAINAGHVDIVLTIDEIPAALERYASLPVLARPVSDPESEKLPDAVNGLSEDTLVRLAALFEAQENFDLRIYKSGTIVRRVLRRMGLSGYQDPLAYLDALRNSPNERRVLVRDLLISVTDFFRDPETFVALQKLAIDPIVSRTAPGAPIRVWVPACATGEEAYSLGIELLESMARHKNRVPLQIFATDLDSDAIAIGRAGVYPSTISDRMSPERLATYFEHLEGRGYRVRNTLRDTISFAVHDLTKDPPFSRINLVSCRNVLIYLTPEAQQHVLKSIHFALESDGYLMLSNSETVGPQREVFTVHSKPHRIYRKFGASREFRAQQRAFNPPPIHALSSKAEQSRRKTASAEAQQTDLARRTIMEAWVPATLIVSEDGTVIYSHGALDTYLRFPQGENPSLELAEILKPDTATRVRGAVFRARQSGEVVVTMSADSGTDQAIKVTARPTPSIKPGAVMVTFEDVAYPSAAGVEPPASPLVAQAQDQLVAQLEQELKASREDLRNTVEELESTNEALRSSNEESLSMNEELQSTNEELEATTEELRSLNEELTAVNSQLRDKILQLEQAHDDLNNFVTSTAIATIFLDERLCIHRSTPAARELLAIDYSDIGRRVGDIAREPLQVDLEKEAKAVLQQLTPRNREFQLSDGRWLERNILPYRTESRRIEGVVVTFRDITGRRGAETKVEQSRRRMALTLDAAALALFEYNPEADTVAVDDRAKALFGLNKSTVTFVDWLQTFHAGDQEKVRRQCTSMNGSNPLQAIIRSTGAGATRRVQLWIVSDSNRGEGRPRLFVGAVKDITDEYKVRQETANTAQRLKQTIRSARLGVFEWDIAEDTMFWMGDAQSVFGRPLDAGTTKLAQFLAMVHPADRAVTKATMESALEGDHSYEAEYRVFTADGSVRWVTARGDVIRDASGHPIKMHGVHFDSTDRKGSQRPTSNGVRQLRLASQATGFGSYEYDLVTEDVTWTPSSYQLWDIDPDTPLSLEFLFGRIVAEDLPRAREDFEAAKSPDGTDVHEFLYRIQTKRRGVRWIRSIARTEFDKGQPTEPRRLVGIMQDVTDFVRAEQRLRTVFDWAPDAIAVVSSKHELIFANPAFLKLIGKSEQQLVDTDVRQYMTAPPELFEAGYHASTELVLRSAVGLEFPVECKPIDIEFDETAAKLLFMRDLSDRKRMEARVARTEQLASMGMLIAGVSHEINNPLGFVVGNLEELVDKPAIKADPCTKEAAEDAYQGAKRIASIVEDLQTFIKSDNEQMELVDIGETVQRTIRLAQPKVRHRAEISVHVDKLPRFWTNEGRVSQVLLNLIYNAAEAMPADRRVDENRISVVAGISPSSLVISVEDNGRGISKPHLKRVFDPFYSTRKGEGGTGLGLTISSSVIQQIGGFMEARSEIGKGSQFTIHLPLPEAGSAPLVATEAPADRPTPVVIPADASLKSLVVDDEPAIRRLITRVLSSYGSVTTAASGRAAQQLLDSNDEFDIVICDVIMKDGDGAALYDWITEHRPQLANRVLFITGMTHPESTRPNVPVIQKPFTTQRFLSAIFNVLEKQAVGDEKYASSPPGQRN